MECPPATSTNRRKLKFYNMQKPVSSNPLLPFLLTHFSVARCKFHLKSVLSSIPGPNETVDRLDQGPTCSLPGHHILISSVMLYLTPQTRCTITAESSKLLGGPLKSNFLLPSSYKTVISPTSCLNLPQ